MSLNLIGSSSGVDGYQLNWNKLRKEKKLNQQCGLHMLYVYNTTARARPKVPAAVAASILERALGTRTMNSGLNV